MPIDFDKLFEVSSNELITLIKKNMSDTFIQECLTFEKKTGTSLLGNIIQVHSYEIFEIVIKILKRRTQRINIRSLLHFYVGNLTIPQKVHPVYMCYSKYGYDTCLKMINKYYDKNTHLLNILKESDKENK